MNRVASTGGLVLLLAALAGACGGDPSPAEPDAGEATEPDAAVDPCVAGTAGVVCRLAGTGELAFDGDGRASLDTSFYLPSRVRRGPDGLLYVMDFNNHRLRRIAADGTVETVIGNGFHGVAQLDVPAIDSPLENPIDFAFQADGRIVFVQYHDPRILRLEPDGMLSVLAGTGELAIIGNEGDGGPALDAQFIELTGLAIASDGAIFVSDSTANRVRVVRDGVVDTVAGTGIPGYAGDGGAASAAALDFPTAVELDPAGRLHIADYRNRVVRRVEQDGTIATVAGNGSKGISGDGGTATEAQLGGPDGLAFAPDGTMYLADRDNFRVRRVDADGVITTIAGTGVQGLSGDGGPALTAEFAYVSRLTLEGDELLVADQSNSCARGIALADAP